MGSAFPGPLFAVSVGRLAKRLLMALLYVPKTVPLDLTSIVQLSPFLASGKEKPPRNFIQSIERLSQATLRKGRAKVVQSAILLKSAVRIRSRR